MENEVRIESCLCDNCKQPPRAFRADSYGGEPIFVWYVVVPKDAECPMTLMSSGRRVFKFGVTKLHYVVSDESFLCLECFESLYPAGEL